MTSGSYERYTHYERFVPSAPLSRFVESLWSYRGYRPPHASERVLPSGTVELIIPLGAQPLVMPDAGTGSWSSRGAIVSGVRADSFDIGTHQQKDLIGVHFRPGGAWPLLGVPLDAIQNRHVELEALWGRSAYLLLERVVEARPSSEAFRILSAALLERWRHAKGPLHQGIQGSLRAMMSADAVPAPAIARLADRAGLSHRRFVELFRREVGLPPKSFARVHRFQRALQRLFSEPDAPAAAIALDAGYCDQAHWINECRSIAGTTPSRLAAWMRTAPRYIPAEERGQILPIPIPSAPLT
ncbi:DUF6597 domain-containing transcriptional factor [Pendulispora albinea]|uniref:Helix-turn-helix domain-containing protein n=1 Tax=Pendulispora albinea TaxID=2741071 RepID=A0ABZ2LZG1_9BACT